MPCRQATSPTPQPHLTWACSAFPREVPCPKRGIKRPHPHQIAGCSVVLHGSMAVGVMPEAGLCLSARNAVRERRGGFDHADQPGWLLGSSPSSFCRSGKAPDPGSAPSTHSLTSNHRTPANRAQHPHCPVSRVARIRSLDRVKTSWKAANQQSLPGKNSSLVPLFFVLIRRSMPCAQG